MLLQCRERNEFFPAIRITKDGGLVGRWEMVEKAMDGVGSHDMDGPGRVMRTPGGDTGGLLWGGLGRKIGPDLWGTSCGCFALEGKGMKKKVRDDDQEEGGENDPCVRQSLHD